MDNPAPDASTKPADVTHHIAEAATTQLSFGGRFFKKHGWRTLLWFFGLLLPLWGFGSMADRLHDGQMFPFDLPILNGIHALANAGFDKAFVLISAAGYAWGVVPVDAVLIATLAMRRHVRESLFAGTAIIGSLLLNLAAKHSFARARPGLWQSIVSENTYSFPSGHAMGSMTLAWVVVLLCWNARSRWGWSWRWPITIAATLFVLLVGLSRVYLGVHYPSDILAGWAAASVWVVGVYGLVFYGTLRPWQSPSTAPVPTHDPHANKGER